MRTATRSKITYAAAQLLEEVAFDEISTKEIAKLAGVSEATLFRHMGSKQHLLYMVYGDRLDDLLSEIEISDLRVQELANSDAQSVEWYKKRILAIYEVRTSFYMQNPVNAALYLRAGFDGTNPDHVRNLAQGDRSIRLTTQILLDASRNRRVGAAMDPLLVAQNVHAIYMHEIDRGPVRGYSPDTAWARIEPRILAQLDPVFAAIRPAEPS